MDFIIEILLGIGLAMDAFSVSITRGLAWKCQIKHALIIAILFGFFQGFLPVLGWISGLQLQIIISTVAPWVAFILLNIIGIKMIYESICMADDEVCPFFSFKELLILSIATSIDAFAVGVTFAVMNTPIIEPILIIGLITFILSFLGVYLGKSVGRLFENKIEILGGIILIGIGFKILLENLLF
ncbi:MAG: manganese efflux pump MntP family protein [Methanobacteriaceae archaeon]|nr:manganese efflux pump MntP family protein [Methanobacteriaceae archaeon]